MLLADLLKPASACYSLLGNELMDQDNNKYRPPFQGDLVDDDKSKSKGPSMLVNIIIAVFCAIYLVNPTLGVIEFLPDNLPIIGNLDEATATAGLLYALSELGLIPWKRK